MTRKGDRSRPFQIVPPDGGNGETPDHWPECPAYLSESQRGRFLGVCRRLDEQGTLEGADVGDIEALAIAEDNLELATAAVNAGGKYATVVKQGRPYQCPACKGSGRKPQPKGVAGPVLAPVTSLGRRPPGRPCSICALPNRGEIESALGRGASVNGTAKRFAVSSDALLRHKREHLGKPARPVLVDPSNPTCMGCEGKGIIIPETREVAEKRPENTDQRYAIDQVAKLSAKFGLDVISRVRVKGKPADRKQPSALKRLLEERDARK